VVEPHTLDRRRPLNRRSRFDATQEPQDDIAKQWSRKFSRALNPAEVQTPDQTVNRRIRLRMACSMGSLSQPGHEHRHNHTGW